MKIIESRRPVNIKNDKFFVWAYRQQSGILIYVQIPGEVLKVTIPIKQLEKWIKP